MVKVNLGAEKKREGWIGVNVDPQWEVEVVADAADLPFKDGEADVLYCSHVLEHLTYRDNQLKSVLAEMYRVLKPGGTLYVSVPDMPKLCDFYTSTEGADRIHIMRIILGGQISDGDTHRVGFDQNLIAEFLHITGFESIKRVESFGIFEDDCSALTINGQNISINLLATRS